MRKNNKQNYALKDFQIISRKFKALKLNLIFFKKQKNLVVKEVFPFPSERF